MIADNRLNLTRFMWFLMMLGLLVSACNPGGPMNNSENKVLLSQVQREMNPGASKEDLETLVEGNTDFALDFFQNILGQDGNLFFSPYSISTALAMTYGGARGLTAGEMADVLHFVLPQERLHPAFNQLEMQINRVSETSNEEQQPFRLDVANSLWGQTGHPFKQEFLDLLAMNYGAGLRLVDFVQNSEGARQEINQWVSEKTQEKIQDLIPPGAVQPESRLVLANAIYFKADWLYPFQKDKTNDAPFYLPDGSTIQVPMMAYEDPEDLPYYSGDIFQVVELPYLGDEVSMLVLVPEMGKMEEFESRLNADLLEEVLNKTQNARIRLFLPKFKFSSEYELTDILSSLGMPDAFCSGVPDFSGMDEDGQLCIGGAFHKAFVAVDEKGTEAAAATAIVMKALALLEDDVRIITIDHPFLFMIRHNTSGTVLFIGRVNNPQS